MSTLWRIALAWMLALALPLQGFAAQRLLAGAFAPVAAQGAAPASLEAGLPQALVDGHAGHCEQAAAAAVGAEPAVAAEPTKAAKSASTGSCSACASCCHAAALPPSVPQLPLLPLALPEAPEVHLPLAFVWLDGPERPPRAAQR